MNLYFFEGFSGNSQVSEALLIEALSMYCDEKNIQVDSKNIEIYRESGQKPYANLKDVHFNVSHTGCLWVCAVSDSEIGIDIQEIVNKDFEKLAKRYFTEKEQHHVELWGSEGFYNIWVRKEAYCKLKGQSVFSVLANIETTEKDFYKNKIEDAFIYEVEIGPDIKCVAASREEGKEICIRLIN